MQEVNEQSSAIPDILSAKLRARVDKFTLNPDQMEGLITTIQQRQMRRNFPYEYRLQC